MIKLTDIYWTAGFLEGEGCFSFVEKKKYPGRYDIRVAAAQKQRQPLERLQQLFGGSIYDSARISCWTMQGRKAIGLMMTLWPVMSPRRREKIEDVIEKWKGNTPRNYDGEANPAAKLTIQQVRKIRLSSENAATAALRYHVTVGAIRHIRARISWRNVQ